ncbi:acyl-CoA dehydrogenase [Phreatobacter cathodiphilus]|uniref:Acyl-CoA dehydrogenase n=1 Tax=Phreatobacter cathodiphilus TaxID=1868589 RepID=A0A2S0NEI4_9HYPH|nr:acyl-CoA dehydrogenase [Phreatobacter cathodiphilus]AVO46558.1 acyl-CoA dehydrogenase [Phreatobacter cathodiphilus]
MTDTLIADTADRLMAEVVTPAAVRGLKDRAAAAPVWSLLAESGFLDALVAEADGGAGLTAAEALPVLLAAGRHALPLPLGATMAARAAIAAAGEAAPEGMIALAASARRDGDDLVAQVPAGEFADAVLVPSEGGAMLLAVGRAAEEPTGEGSFCRLRWRGANGPLLSGFDPLLAGARIEAAEMAGAMEAMLATTLRYANDRSQFGKPIGKFQAVQQQLAVMTERVHGARAAADLAARAPDVPEAVATAKITIGEAAAEVTAIAHAVHGAIGMTEELDLHLLSDRLRRGRLRYGSERHWAGRLGEAVLAAPEATLLDFVRARVFL